MKESGLGENYEFLSFADKEAAKIEQWKRQVILEHVEQSTLAKPHHAHSVQFIRFGICNDEDSSFLTIPFEASLCIEWQ